MTNPHVIIVGADKGGVGKTFFSRLLLSYLEKRHAGVEVHAYDGQKPNGILRRFHPAAVVVDVRKSDDQVKIFDNMRAGEIRLVDLAAGDLDPLLGVVGDLGFLEDVRNGQLKVTVFHLIGSTKSSFDEIASVKQRVAGARHFLVTNHINDASYQGLTAELRAQADGVIDIPKLDAMATELVDQQGAPFNAFVANDHNSLVLRRYVSSWQDKCFVALAGVH